jgi:multisubunit Na+/H+ antiporter MnhE subunit
VNAVFRVAIATAALTTIYLLALASLDPWDIGIGALLSCGVVLLFRQFLFLGPAAPPATIARRAGHFPRLALATAGEIVRGTVAVARAVLSGQPPRHAGLVAIPVDGRTPTGVIISAWLNTLSPGSVYVGADPQQETWTIHALDAEDGDAIRSDAQRFYDRYQRPVWP